MLGRLESMGLELGDSTFLRKQNEAKTFELWIDSPKVRDSLLIHESPKWILRYAQYDDRVNFRFVAKSHDNRSNGGVAFVFVRIFGIETRLGVCEIPKFSKSAKLHTPEQIVSTQKDKRAL